MFSVHAQVKYKKSVWGVVKGFIEKNTWAGLEDFYTALLRALQSEYCIPPAKAKGRRPRRGTASQQRPPEDLISSKTPKNLPFAALNNMDVPMKVQASGSPVKRPQRFEPLSLFVIGLMIVLVLLNVILYFKLWNFEDLSSSPPPTHFEFRLLK